MRVLKLAPHVLNCQKDATSNIDWAKQLSASTPYTLSSRVEIFPSYYDKEHRYNPLRSEYRFLGAGSSSWGDLVETRSIQTGQTLQRIHTILVWVDSVTRRPCIPPSDIREYMQKGSDSKEFAESRIQVTARPETYFEKSTYEIRWSDTDRYEHVNQSVYYRVAYDVISEASVSGYLSRLKGVLFQYHIKSGTCLIRQELKAGDNIAISVWENEKDPLLIFVQGHKSSSFVFQCSMHFILGGISTTVLSNSLGH